MKATKLNLCLAAPIALAMLLALAGCEFDHHDHDRDEHHWQDSEHHDSGDHGGDHHDEEHR